MQSHSHEALPKQSAGYPVRSKADPGERPIVNFTESTNGGGGQPGREEAEAGLFDGLGRSFSLEAVGDFMKELGLTSPQAAMPKMPSALSPENRCVAAGKGAAVGKGARKAPQMGSYDEKQRVQVWSQSAGEWMDAIVTCVYQDGAVAVTYLDKPANKVIPPEALAAWVRSQPYASVWAKDE